MGMNSVSIIGAGPAGLSVAMKLKENGFDPVIYEEHEKVGIPEHCSGLISKAGLDKLNIDFNETIQNKVYGAKIFSPDGTMLKVERKTPVAYIIDRKEFDQLLLRNARLKGIHVATQTKLIDSRKSITGNELTMFVQVEGRGEMRKTQYLVGADGAISTVRHIMEINTEKKDFIHTIQATCKGEFDERYVEVYLTNHAKGFFAWMIPINKEKAKIGLGNILGDYIAENFKSFLNEKFPNVKVLEKNSALIPCGDPLNNITKENYALVGDAAFQTKATTGGGVIFGMNAGNILGDVLSEVLKKNGNLKDYERKIDPLNKELKLHYKIRRYLNSLSEQEINDLFKKLKQKGIEEFLEKEGSMDEPSKFIGKLALNPGYWFMTGTLIKFLQS